ncbi:MAG: DUF2167 domain-containing protein [Rhodocyclaceae bacterium]|nr:DUF2167 domain-containing protein [Rhodocyclaceae bacterium]MBX3671151.1 DUF2167 domain-containing protein [Rhodocyclaceae bacterium]
MNNSKQRLFSFLFVLLGLIAAPMAALSADGDASARIQAEINAAFEAAKPVAQHGPVDIKLIDQAVLKLPAGHVYIPSQQAAALLRAMGNHPGPDLIGLILPTGDGEWMVVARFEKSGYIKDDDARDWNSKELLDSLKEGTEAGNQERRERGFPELEVLGWIEAPAYESATHRLVWSASSRHKGQSGGPQGVNYNTYALGRDGYISLNLITDEAKINGDKPVAKALLAALDYNDGKRYADFNASTDKVAEYGLAALVAGVAAKKLGLFAMAGLMIAKFWKIALLALVGAGAGLKKFFGRKNDSA